LIPINMAAGSRTPSVDEVDTEGKNIMAGDRIDVLVVGCGIAGLSAAVSAAERGARVAVIERAPREERGGNTRYTESFWRMKSETQVADDFEDRFADNGVGHADPALLREAGGDPGQWSGILRAAGMVDPHVVARIAEDAPHALAWLKGFGVRFDFLPIYFLSQSTTRIAPVGGGLALIEALAGHAESVPERIGFHYETTALGLLFDDAGAVRGLQVKGPGNRPFEMAARCVVLASGGFQGNQEMLAHYVGPQSAYTRPVARGGYYNRGEGIRMALEAGAAPCGNFGSFHAQPVDPRSEDAEPVVLNFAFGVLVNRHGLRFTDEGAAMTDAIYEEVARSIMMQPEGIAWAVFDQRLDEVEDWSITVRSRVPPLQGDTPEDLARLMGVPAADLADTLSRFNDACGDCDGFTPRTPDGLATRGITPRKSNWARPVSRGPFRAWPIIAANCFTFGGLKIDTRARVVNTAGDPIPGLYAAGETVGLYYRIYPGATSVLRGAVTGRLAGIDAATRNA
jgi:tricarballylate dehydrogenase